MIGYIMQLIVSWLVQVLIHKPKKRVKRPAGQQGLDVTTLDILCQGSSAALESRGMAQLMCRDFSFSRHLTQGDIQSPALTQKLTAMAREVTDSLSLPPLKEVTVQLIPLDSTEYNNIGTYESRFHRINFYIKPDRFPEQVEAALCHECTHYFMDTFRLDDWTNQSLNERRTDVMACLIGFSNIMIRGYTVLTRARYRVVTWEADSMRVGYLDAVDCEHVRGFLLKHRQVLQQKLQAEQSAKAMKSDLERSIVGARAMLEQLETMRALCGMPKTKRLSGKELARLQKALLSLESGELTTRLRQCESMPRDSEKQLRSARQAIDDLCEDLTVLHAAFR